MRMNLLSLQKKIKNCCCFVSDLNSTQLYSFLSTITVCLWWPDCIYLLIYFLLVLHCITKTKP